VGSPPSTELESFLGTVPGMIYRTRLVPPYEDDFISAELFSVVGYPAEDFVGRDPKRRWPDLIDPEDRERVKEGCWARQRTARSSRSSTGPAGPTARRRGSSVAPASCLRMTGRRTCTVPR
jgi:hypothetical protein